MQIHCDTASPDTKAEASLVYHFILNISFFTLHLACIYFYMKLPGAVCDDRLCLAISCV